MRNGKFSYLITGLVRSVYDIWEMYNSHITNEELKPKSWIKHKNGNFVCYSTFLYEVGMTYEKLNIIPDWTWSMNDVWKMWNFPAVKHVHKLIEIIWKINSKYKL